MTKIWRKIRYNRLIFFLIIVWRKWEEDRMDWATAWEVAGIIYPKGE